MHVGALQNNLWEFKPILEETLVEDLLKLTFVFCILPSTIYHIIAPTLHVEPGPQGTLFRLMHGSTGIVHWAADHTAVVCLNAPRADADVLLLLCSQCRYGVIGT